jgi:hypothetical protein
LTFFATSASPPRQSVEPDDDGSFGSPNPEEQETPVSTKNENENENQSENKPAEEALTDEQLESVAGGTLVRSWSTNGGDLPTEQISFNYVKIEFDY